jgi:hypothetical protein
MVHLPSTTHVSHKFNPLSIPQCYMEISTLGHVGGGNRCGGGYPVESYYDTCWLTGLWSTQDKVEGIVLKAAWHWCSNSSVVNDPLGELGRTQRMKTFHPRGAPWKWLYVSPLFHGWASWLGTLRDINEWINHRLWKRSITLHRGPAGGTWRGLIYWGLWEVRFCIIRRTFFGGGSERCVKEGSGNGHLSP